MDPIEQLRAIVPAMCEVVDHVAPEQMTAPTPCTEFTVHDVLDHVMVLGGAFAHLFRGEAPPDIEAPAVYGRVPAAEVRRTLEDLLDAVSSDGAMERILPTPLGEMDGETFARVVAFDGLVHGWDIAVATGLPYRVPTDVIAAVHEFARTAIDDGVRATGMFLPPSGPPADATPIELLAAFSGRTVEPRWRPTPNAIHLDKTLLPVKIDVPGARARQAVAFGDATGYGRMAGEYFSLGAGTDIAPLLRGLDGDTCHAPHWGYMLSGELVVSFVDGSEETCRGGEIFYWAPGHSVRVVADAEVVLFSPEHEHVDVLDHMLEVMASS